METLIKAVGGVAVFLGILLIVSVLIGLPVMLLWNWLMPTIFGLPELGFWQSVGVSLLCSCMFKTSGKV